MSSYDGEDLFSSGPYRFALPRTQLRAEETTALGVDGARLTFMGRSAKRIKQTGRLIAADAAAVLALRDEIGVRCDGRAAELIDANGQAHPNMMIVRFDTADRIDVGRVASLAYEIEYVEAG